MSLTRQCLWLTAVLAVVSLADVARAQHFDKFQPFIEPDTWNPDLQFFAPAEVSTFGGGDPPNIGFYATYDRVYMNMTRPEGFGPFPDNPPNSPIDYGPFNPEPLGPTLGSNDTLGSLYSPWEGDFTWGNRFDVGYMTEDNVGWNSVIWHIDGPNEYLTRNQERVDRINEDSTPADPEAIDPILVDRNPRIYQLKDSINAAALSSFELNRVWRRKEFHGGGVFEPMIGVRYMKFDDYVRRDRYARFLVNPPPGDNYPNPFAPTADGPGEVYLIDKTHWENNMLGGQLGFRLSKTYGHWNLSTEMRAFALQNWQFFMAQSTRTYTLYTGRGEGSPVEAQIVDKDRIYNNNAEFVWGGEIRGEAAYEVTRDISLRFGFIFMDLGQGVARSNHPTSWTDQDVQMGGVTFGLTLNR